MHYYCCFIPFFSFLYYMRVCVCVCDLVRWEILDIKEITLQCRAGQFACWINFGSVWIVNICIYMSVLWYTKWYIYQCVGGKSVFDFFLFALILFLLKTMCENGNLSVITIRHSLHPEYSIYHLFSGMCVQLSLALSFSLSFALLFVRLLSLVARSQTMQMLFWASSIYFAINHVFLGLYFMFLMVVSAVVGSDNTYPMVIWSFVIWAILCSLSLFWFGP